jgi:hypothetical protein
MFVRPRHISWRPKVDFGQTPNEVEVIACVG